MRNSPCRAGVLRGTWQYALRHDRRKAETQARHHAQALAKYSPENPAVAVVVDRYDEDWSRLGWVMLHGRAEILSQGKEHDDAQLLLRSRYGQLDAMQIAGLPVIAVRIERATQWGNLSVPKGVAAKAR